MKRRVLLISIMTAIGVGLVLGSSQAKPLAPSIKVGVMVSASGPLYFASGFQRAGCELAEAEVNISCNYADAGDSEGEAKAALKLLKASKAELIIAPIDSESVRRVSKLNQQNPLPIIAASSIAEAISATVKDKNWLFRLATTSTQDTSTLADYLTETKAESVVILAGPETYSKLNAKLLQFGLVMRGISDVRQFSLQEMKSARATSPDAVVLISLESSVDFLSGLSQWFKKVPRKYLVAGNLANYSMYSWASDLAGAKALMPTDEIPEGFRADVAEFLNRPNLLSNPKSPMFGLAWRTYKAAKLAASLQNERRESLERMKQTFSPTGYYLGQKYVIYGYGAKGTITEVGRYQPDTP